MSEFAMRKICNEEYPPKSNSCPGIIYCDYIPMSLTPNTWEKHKGKNPLTYLNILKRLAKPET